ncbi:unnamed protein product [Ixodes pacificus]
MECAHRPKCWGATYLEGEENPVKCWGGHKPPLCHHLRSFGRGRRGWGQACGKGVRFARYTERRRIPKKQKWGVCILSASATHETESHFTFASQYLSRIYAPVWCLWVPVAVKNEGG